MTMVVETRAVVVLRDILFGNGVEGALELFIDEEMSYDSPRSLYA